MIFSSALKKKDTRIVLLLISGTLLFRLFTLEVIEDSGDGMFYWQAARLLELGKGYSSLTHWNTRFAVILPVLVCMKIFGTSPLVYYICPLIMSLLQTLLLFHLMKKLFDLPAALLSVILLQLYPEMVRASSQLLPGVFSATYVLASVVCIVHYISSDRYPILYLIGASFFMFLAYETKITNLFYLPGCALILLYLKRDIRPPLIFGMVLLLLFLGECLLYYHFTGDALARVHAITGKHLSNVSRSIDNVFYIFYRWVRPGAHFVLVLCFFFYAVYGYTKKRFKRELGIILFPLASFIFLITFTFKSFDPLVPVTNFQIRYWNTALPLLLGTVSIILTSQNFPFLRQRKIVTFLVTGLVFIRYIILFSPNILHHPMVSVMETYQSLNRAMNEKIPVLYEYETANILNNQLNYDEARKDGNSREKALEITGMSQHEFTSVHKQATAVIKSRRLLESIFLDLSWVHKKTANLYPYCLSFYSYTENDKTAVGIYLNGENGEEIVKQAFTDPEKPVLTIHRRPIRLSETTGKIFLSELE